MKKIKKHIMKLPKKIMTSVIVLAMIFGYFSPIANVFAEASATKLSVTFRDGNANYGKVQYSLDGITWNDITGNTQNKSISVTGDNLKLKIVPNENYDVDYAGIEMIHDNNKIGGLSTIGLESEDGYSVPSNVEKVELTQVEFKEAQYNPSTPVENNTTSKVTVSVSGEELEYDMPWSSDACSFVFGINNGDMKRLSKDEVNYTQENNQITGLVTKNEFDYGYNYDNEGTVRFTIRTQWDDVITSLKINNVSYETPTTKNDLINAYENGGISFEISNVPYAETYNIEVVGRKQTENEKIMGNFGWTYDPNTNEFSDDDKIPYGNLEFVKAVYNNVTYNTPEEVNAAGGVFKWHNGAKGSSDPYGEAAFPVGTVLTIKLIPDSGYQLTSFDLNGFPFEPGEEVGLYTFTIGGGNWHLGAHFTKVSDKVQTNSSNIKSGNINIDKSNSTDFENGTAKLEVNNATNITQNRIEDFENTAAEQGYEIENYLDISLYNSIYKGGVKDNNGNYESWDTEVNNLDKNATISLELNENMSGKDLAVVHETHNGDTITGYELIDATYNKSNNTITFETDSFSNYAIVSKTASEANQKTYTIKDKQGNIISFKEEKGHTYNLDIIDYLSYTKKQVMEAAGISSQEYDQVFDGLKKATKKYGTMIGLYEISVTDEQDHNISEGPFNIKIKLTDKMKKYNSFKLIYVTDDLTLGEVVTLKVEGDYLVGTLPHLSTYALVGNNVNNKITSPQTGDNIYIWLSTFAISIIGLASIIVTNKKYVK